MALSHNFNLILNQWPLYTPKEPELFIFFSCYFFCIYCRPHIIDNQISVLYCETKSGRTSSLSNEWRVRKLDFLSYCLINASNNFHRPHITFKLDFFLIDIEVFINLFTTLLQIILWDVQIWGIETVQRFDTWLKRTPFQFIKRVNKVSFQREASFVNSSHFLQLVTFNYIGCLWNI